MEGVADPTAIYATVRKGKVLPVDMKECATGRSASNVIMEEATRPGILEKPAGVLLRGFQSTCGSSITRRRGILRSRRPPQPYGGTQEMPIMED